MKKVKPTNSFNDNVIEFETYYNVWLSRLYDMYVTSIAWENAIIPHTNLLIEKFLFDNGQVVVFNDPQLPNLTMLPVDPVSAVDNYGLPSGYTARGLNGYRYYGLVEDENCVIIRSNPSCTPALATCSMYAQKMAMLEISWRANVIGVRHPITIVAPEEMKLSAENLYADINVGKPVVLGNKNMDKILITAIDTGVPYLTDKLSQEMQSVWASWLTYLGVPSMESQKQERMLRDEIASSIGGAIACRPTRMNLRREAAEKINHMFGVNWKPVYAIDKEDVPALLPSMNNVKPELQRGDEDG